MKVRSINQSVVDIVGFLYEVDSTGDVQRGFGFRLGTSNSGDNVGAHLYIVTMFGWVIGKMEGFSKKDINTIIKRCLLHDLNETRISDLDRMRQQYLDRREDEASQDQFAQLPFGEEMLIEVKEYRKGKKVNPIDILVKDADLLASIVAVRKLAVAGNQEAQRWLEGRAMYNQLKTESTKKLADEIYRQRPFAWQDKVLPAESRSR